MEVIEQVDWFITVFINNSFAPWVDQLMLFASSKYGWVPFYLLLLFLVFKKIGWKAGLIFLPFAALTVALADQSSVHLFKEVFERYRPCHNLEIQDQLRMIVSCGGKYGFLSSHATNTAAIATLLFFTLRKNWVTYLLVGYALLNSYSRVYLGKHYVSDVLAGMLLGFTIGWFVHLLFQYLTVKFQFGNHD